MPPRIKNNKITCQLFSKRYKNIPRLARGDWDEVRSSTPTPRIICWGQTERERARSVRRDRTSVKLRSVCFNLYTGRFLKITWTWHFVLQLNQTIAQCYRSTKKRHLRPIFMIWNYHNFFFSLDSRHFGGPNLAHIVSQIEIFLFQKFQQSWPKLYFLWFLLIFI